MSTLFMGQNKIALSTVDSTNNFAANLVNETNVPDGTVILSDNQTHGKGQKGNTWQTEGGKNLTCTYIVKPSFVKINEQFNLSVVVALSIMQVLHNAGIREVTLKWPNDVLIGRNKIAGVLIENQVSGKQLSYSIVGIGLNVNQVNFPTDILATSIQQETGKELDLEDVLNQLSFAFERFYIQLRNNGVGVLLESYYENLLGYQTVRSYKDKTNNYLFEGKIVGVTKEGLLKIEDLQHEIRTFFLKELEFLF